MKENLPSQNLDKFEIRTTKKFIEAREKDGVDCSALREYLKPIIVRVPYGQGKLSSK